MSRRKKAKVRTGLLPMPGTVCGATGIPPPILIGSPRMTCDHVPVPLLHAAEAGVGSADDAKVVSPGGVIWPDDMWYGEGGSYAILLPDEVSC